MTEETTTKLVTPRFRGSYVTLLKPRAIGDGDPEYGMTVVLDKDDDDHIKFLSRLKKEMKAAMLDKLGKEIPFEKCKHFPISDGDDSEQEEFHGKWLIRTKNKRQPGILVLDNDGTRRAIEKESEIYSGAWYHASIKPYAWANEFGKGVSISLNGVLKVDDDEQFGGNSFSESDFDDVPAPKKKKVDEDEDEVPRKKKKPARDEGDSF